MIAAWGTMAVLTGATRLEESHRGVVLAVVLLSSPAAGGSFGTFSGSESSSSVEGEELLVTRSVEKPKIVAQNK
jgi:hypothetical protein